MSFEENPLVAQDPILGSWKIWLSHQHFGVRTIGFTLYN